MKSNNLSFNIDELRQLNEELERLIKNSSDITSAVWFLSISDVMRLTGWSKATTEQLFNQNNFPALEIGRKKLVSVSAFLKYCSVRRDKRDWI